MSEKIKSGKDVIEEFFSEIPNIEGVDKKIADKLLELFRENKFTDSNIQNALEELKQTEIKPRKEKDNGEN